MSNNRELELKHSSQNTEINYEPGLMWKIVKTELIDEKTPSPAEFINHHLVLPYILNPERNKSFNLEKNPHVHHVAQVLAAEHRIPSFEAIINMKEKLLEFQRITTSNMRLMLDDKNHKFINGFVESAGVTVDECVRFATKLIEAHEKYETIREKYKNLNGKEIYHSILTKQEIHALTQVKIFFEEMHNKLLADQQLIKKIIKNQALLKKRDAGELRREEHITSRQLTQALTRFRDDYEYSQESVLKALKKDWKKAKDKQYKKQQILKEVIGAAAGPLIGSIAEKGVGILSSLLQTAISSLNRSNSKHLIQIPMPGIPLSDIEEKGRDTASENFSELGSEEIATRMVNKSFNLEIKLQPKTGFVESFSKMIDTITDAFYKKVFSEEWLEQAAKEIRDELMQSYKQSNKFVAKAEFIDDMNKALEERINDAVETYDKKLRELKAKIITIDDDTPKITSAKVISQIFAIGYTMAGLDEFKDTATFNRELEDFLIKIKNRSGSDHIIEFVRKSEWSQKNIDSLGFMDEKTVNKTLGINGKLQLFGERLKKLTPGKTPKEKMLAANIEKRILTAVALVRIGEIFKQTCGTILYELITPEQAAHALLQIAKQGVDAIKFKEIISTEFTAEFISSTKHYEAGLTVAKAKVNLEAVKKNWNAIVDEDKKTDEIWLYGEAADKLQTAMTTPLPTDKEIIKKLNKKSLESIDNLKKLKKLSKNAALLALKAQEKTEQENKKLEEHTALKEKAHNNYINASFQNIKPAQVAWEVEDKKSSLQREAVKQATQEEEKAKILAEYTASELAYRSKASFRELKESWLFKVFHQIPFLSTFTEDLEVKKHLSLLINFDFALKNSLADNAVQVFLNLETLKGREFCTFLNFRSKLETRHLEFKNMLEKIDIIKSFDKGMLTKELDMLRQILFSTHCHFAKNEYPICSLISLGVSDLFTDIQQEIVTQLLNQVLCYKRPQCDFKMDNIPLHIQQQFYDFNDLLHDNLTDIGQQVSHLFKEYNQLDELIQKFMQYFKGSDLLSYPAIFKHMIEDRYRNENAIKHQFRLR